LLSPDCLAPLAFRILLFSLKSILRRFANNINLRENLDPVIHMIAPASDEGRGGGGMVEFYGNQSTNPSPDCLLGGRMIGSRLSRLTSLIYRKYRGVQGKIRSELV
jgi:hypothetical protein